MSHLVFVKQPQISLQDMAERGTSCGACYKKGTVKFRFLGHRSQRLQWPTAPISLKLNFSASIHCQFVFNSTALANEHSIRNCYQLLNSKELTNLRYQKLIVIRQQLLTVIRFEMWAVEHSSANFWSLKSWRRFVSKLVFKCFSQISCRITVESFNRGLIETFGVDIWLKL